MKMVIRSGKRTGGWAELRLYAFLGELDWEGKFSGGASEVCSARPQGSGSQYPRREARFGTRLYYFEFLPRPTYQRTGRMKDCETRILPLSHWQTREARCLGERHDGINKNGNRETSP